MICGRVVMVHLLLLISSAVLTAAPTVAVAAGPPINGENFLYVSGRYADGKRLWSPRESVLTRYFLRTMQQEKGESWSRDRYTGIPDVANISPKGNYFAIESYHGDEACFCNVRELAVYATRDVLYALNMGLRLSNPKYLISVKEDAVPGIRQVAWLEDESKLLFVKGIGSFGKEQGVQLDTRTGLIEAVTPAMDAGTLIYLAKRGAGAIYTTYNSTDKSQSTEAIFAAQSFALDPALIIRPALSPDGRFAISASGPNQKNNGEYYLVDLKRQQQRPLGLMRGSEEFAYYPGWSPDGRKVLLANVVSPSRSDIHNAIISHDVETGANQVLAAIVDPKTGIRATGLVTGDGKEIQIEFQARDGEYFVHRYAYLDGRWVIRERAGKQGSRPVLGFLDGKTTLTKDLRISVEQSPIQPPVVVARLGKNQVRLSEGDSALAGVWIAPTASFGWTDGEGTSHVAGLILPRELPRDGGRIPLVIQIEAHRPNEFRPDGDISTAAAAQALAARGFAVINIGFPDVNFGGPDAQIRSPRLLVNWVDCVTQALQKQYPIDPTRVGLVGWSYTGFLARYASTFPGKIRPAAAVVADSHPQDYVSYLDGVVSFRSLGEGIALHHGGPFFSSKESWWKTDVGFNTDRARTPILFADNARFGDSRGYKRENRIINNTTIGQFTHSRRPFDFQYLPENAHELMSFRVREMSMQLTLDWFGYWLQGREPSSPDYDKDRGTRWAKIKADWQAQQAWEALGYPVGSKPYDPEVINDAGYKALYQARDMQAAIRHFRLNVERNPQAGYAYDSLGEGYVQAGDRDKAIAAYAKAAELDAANNPNAARFARMLKDDPASLVKIQQQLRQSYDHDQALLYAPIGTVKPTAANSAGQ